ncbi:MAG: hypothetical protein QNJ30_27430 [Kiloniellales bacterium]|nr:hypothetical protein [Kiloniellales bacterium]
MRSRNHRLLGWLLAAALLLPGIANGQDSCMGRDEAITWLETRFGERAIGRGFADDGRVMFEVFVGPKGTWTLLVSTPEGPSCIIADGFDWQQLTPRPEGAAAKAARPSLQAGPL